MEYHGYHKKYTATCLYLSVQVQVLTERLKFTHCSSTTRKDVNSRFFLGKLFLFYKNVVFSGAGRIFHIIFLSISVH